MKLNEEDILLSFLQEIQIKKNKKKKKLFVFLKKIVFLIKFNCFQFRK